MRRCDEKNIVHGARLDGGNPIVEVFTCFLLIFWLFLFHLWLFVVDVAVLLLFFALPITTPGSVARERNWPEVETCLRVISINFPFIPILPIFYIITLNWHCRPTEKSKNIWNFQLEQPVCFSLGSGHVLELHHIKGKRSIECQKFWWVVPIAIEVATVINWRGCAHWQLVYIN